MQRLLSFASAVEAIENAEHLITSRKPVLVDLLVRGYVEVHRNVNDPRELELKFSESGAQMMTGGVNSA